MNQVLRFPSTDQVRLHGVFGDALEASRRGRLSNFIVDAGSPAIALFNPARAEDNREGDWYGEHAGKWLYAAARAAARSGDAELRKRVLEVADYLVSVQRDDGYLGTYAPDRQFTVPQPPRPWSWDGAPAWRTWDVWTHTYLILGLLEAYRLGRSAAHLRAASGIGDLCYVAFVERGLDVTTCGNHHGMSATVLLDGAVELFLATQEPRYLALAHRIVEQADAHSPLALVQRLLAGADASEIATGKAYQLLWNVAALTKLVRVSGGRTLLPALERLWTNVRDHHLSLGGGPWGGAGLRSRECFNPPFVFDPQGYVETCSILAWLQFSRELLMLTGHARYAEAIERTALNDLLGAMASNGEDWCYYSFANGRRVHTTYWRCCKSSGAMALEDLPPLAYALADDGEVRVNLYLPGEATLDHAGSGGIRILQSGGGLLPANVQLRLEPMRPSEFTLALRQPEWSTPLRVRIDGHLIEVQADDDGYARVHRRWHSGERVDIEFGTSVVVHRRSNINVQESRAPDGSPVAQEVLHYDYAAFSLGPLVYATALLPGGDTAPTVTLARLPSAQWLRVSNDEDGAELEVSFPGRVPLRLLPAWRVDGKKDGAWHVTWFRMPPGPVAAASGADPTNCPY